MGIARDIKRMLSGYAGCHIIGLINLLHNYWKEKKKRSFKKFFLFFILIIVVAKFKKINGFNAKWRKSAIVTRIYNAICIYF